MKDQYVLKKEDFDALLALFSEDREEAGRIYERVRNGLERFFTGKGCRDAAQLADETLNRVASKAGTFDLSANTRPVTFVYGFAAKIYLEQARVRPTVPIDQLLNLRLLDSGAFEFEDPHEMALSRLDECLSELSDPDRQLIVSYYSREKQERIDLRKRLAKDLGLRPEVLHMKVFRIRESLRICLKKRLDGEK